MIFAALLATPARRPWPTLLAWSAATFLAALFLYTRANQFPYVYHPDEPSKAEQVATAQYNFNHPQLLLRSAEAAAMVRTGSPRGEVGPDEPVLPRFQRIVVGGRWASAGFAALAAATLAGLAWRTRGPVAGVAAGLGLAVLPPLLALAHFFKEDTVFVFTVAVWLAAATWHARRPSWRSVVGLGLACGLALCGKWIGALLTVGGLLLIAIAGVGGRRGWRPPALALAAAAGVVLLVNLPALWQLDALLGGVSREAAHVATGHEGLALPRLPVYLAELWALGPVVLGLAAFELVLAGLRPDRRRRGWWLVPAVAVAFALLVFASRVVTPRYLLPTVVLLVVLAAMGLGSLVEVLGPRRRLAAAGLATALLGLWLVPAGLESLDYLRAFRRDTRVDAREWAAANLPADGRLVFDNWTGLRPWDVAMPAEMRLLPLADRTPEGLAAEGFTHLAVADRSYEQYFVRGVRPVAGGEAALARVRERYARLLSGRAGERLAVFETNRPRPTHMSPRVSIYRLPPPP